MLKTIALSILFILLDPNQALAAVPEPVSSCTATSIQHKSGWIKRLTQVSLFRHANQQDSLSQEKPSKLARAAVILLGVSYVGTAVFGNLFMPVAYIGLAGILVANILAIIVLGRKPNKKSKKYARGILIITGIMIASALLLIGAINLLFPGAI